MSSIKLILLTWIMLAFGTVHGAAHDSWVLNLPGAPMHVEGQAHGAYRLKNTSGRGIRSFRLGCVEQRTKTEVVIVFKLALQEFLIPPNGSFGEAIVDAPYTDAYGECVVKLKAKLALISTTFEDKTSWEFAESVPK